MKEFNTILPDRSIGKKLKEIRENLNLSLDEISTATKIRKEYLDAIEHDNFNKFDSAVYAKGFIRNYANYLGTDANSLISVYKRDYEDNKIEKRHIFKEPPVGDKNKEDIKKPSPLRNIKITKRKISFFIGLSVIIIFVVLLSALISKTFSAPILKLTAPVEFSNSGSVTIETEEKRIQLIGETGPDTLIKVNEEPITLKPGYKFVTDFLPTSSASNLYIIQAFSQMGIKSEIQLEVIRKDIGDINEDKGIIVKLSEKPTFILVRADGIIKFNDIALPNEVIEITADKTLEIESSEPQYISVEIRGVEYIMEKIFERFDLGSEEVVRLN